MHQTWIFKEWPCLRPKAFKVCRRPKESCQQKWLATCCKLCGHKNKIKIFVVQIFYRLVCTTQCACHESSSQKFLYPCNTYFSKWSSTYAKISNILQLQSNWNFFNALNEVFYGSPLSDDIDFFFWEIMICLGCKLPYDKIFIFPVDPLCPHRDWLIGSIWLSHCSYQRRICQYNNVPTKELKRWWCCELAWSCTSTLAHKHCPSVCIHTILIYSAILLFIQPYCYWFEGKIRDKCHLLASHNLHLGFPVSVPPAMPSPWGEALPLPSFVLTIISICQAQIDGAFLNAMHDSEYSLLSLFWPWGAGIVWWDCNHLYNQRAAPSESFLTVAQSSCLEQQTAKLLQRGILEREQQNYCWEQTKGISLCLTTF